MAFYKEFEPRQTLDLARRNEFRYRSKQGSRLNVAEAELSTLLRQRLIGWLSSERATLQAEGPLRSMGFRTRQRRMDWSKTVEDARYKLGSVYSKVVM